MCAQHIPSGPRCAWGGAGVCGLPAARGQHCPRGGAGGALAASPAEAGEGAPARGGLRVQHQHTPESLTLEPAAAPGRPRCGAPFCHVVESLASRSPFSDPSHIESVRRCLGCRVDSSSAGPGTQRAPPLGRWTQASCSPHLRLPGLARESSFRPTGGRRAGDP